MACISNDALDKNLLKYVKSIEKNYYTLSKQHRIRVERWVEKLISSSGSNYSWKKDRNNYAKLLLHMILVKQLSEPFHVMPSDGPLSTFPIHLLQNNGLVNDEKLSQLEDHRISFWKDIYRRINDDSNMNISGEPENRIGSGLLTESNSVANIEIERLRKIIADQDIRMNIIEQQLRDEKLRYAYKIRQLQATHEAEISYISKKTVSSSSIFSNLQHKPITPTPSSSGLQLNRSSKNNQYLKNNNGISNTGNSMLSLPCETNEIYGVISNSSNFDSISKSDTNNNVHHSMNVPTTDDDYEDFNIVYKSNLENVSDNRSYKLFDSLSGYGNFDETNVAQDSDSTNIVHRIRNQSTNSQLLSSTKHSKDNTVINDDDDDFNDLINSELKQEININDTISSFKIDKKVLNQSTTNKSMDLIDNMTDLVENSHRNILDNEGDDKSFLEYIENFQEELKNMQFT